MSDATSDPSYLEALNPEQRRAVEHFAGPLLILAGAGSGKTRVITTKIAWLIDRKRMNPRSILAVTFTNKAAQEMKERVLGMAPHGEEVMLRTFHSFGAWLLRRNAALLGLDSRFLIYDEDDSLSLLRAELGEGTDRGALRAMLAGIARAKDLGLAPSARPEDLARVGCDPETYAAYERRLRATGNLDFGDLIMLAVRLLREQAEVRDRTRQRFRVVLVDEYQDSNVAQFQLLRELWSPETYLCVVGDDDQSIYRFRGAEIGNILSFSDAFPGTEVIRLERNYRSTQAILDVASAVVSHNRGRLGKTLWTEREAGEPVSLASLADQDEEAAFCARLVSDGSSLQTAILYRTNAQSRTFEECFVKAGIPHRVVGTVRFYAREEVKDVIAWLALLVNPRDEVSFRRIVNKPARGLGKTSVDRILGEWRSGGGTLWDACSRAASSLGQKARLGTGELETIRGELAGALARVPLSELVSLLLERTGLASLYAESDQTDGTAKTENLQELVNATAAYGTGPEALDRFLENVALASGPGEPGEDADDGRRVILITLHNTKGLEFDRVIITGLEEGIFPHSSAGGDPEELEEERRLFYVGITRAREQLWLTSCRRRRVFGRWTEQEASRFLDEIPPESLRVLGDFAEGGEWGRPAAAARSGAARLGTAAAAGAKAARMKAARSPVEGEDDWPLGAGVFHESYGTGIITRRWRTKGNLVVQVSFLSGRTARFLPRYARLERASEE